MRFLVFILIQTFTSLLFAAPSQPGALRVIDNTSSHVEVAWGRSTGSGDLVYAVFRNNYFIAHTSGLSYKDYNVRSGDSYEYSVKATDWTSVSSKTAATVTVGTYQVVGSPSSGVNNSTSPTQPSNLRVIDNTAQYVEFAWQASQGNLDAILYAVFRNGYFIGLTRSLSFKDEAVRSGDAYNYSVKATNWNAVSNPAALEVTVGGASRKIASQAQPSRALQARARLPIDNNLPVEGAWNLEWADEFEGAAGDLPSLPWHFDATYNGDEKKHRQAMNTKEHAFLDGESHLKMEVVQKNGRTETSILRTSHFDDGRNILAGPPQNLLLDPSSGPLYIETAVRFDKAYKSEDAWWAFWLFPPDTWNEKAGRLWDNFSYPGTPRLEPYEGNAQTGMEVDIFEYVPYLGGDNFQSRNGFNMAAFKGFEPHNQKHMENGNNGFVGEINKHLSDIGRSPASSIDLTDGNFHRIGMFWNNDRYEFYIDNQKVWEITDRDFVTRSRANAMVLSWEVENGVWGDSYAKTFASHGQDLSVLIDYVRVYRGQ